eukprot:6200958-Pleurochrysis_carterae.AAC.1
MGSMSIEFISTSGSIACHHSSCLPDHRRALLTTLTRCVESCKTLDHPTRFKSSFPYWEGPRTGSVFTQSRSRPCP